MKTTELYQHVLDGFTKAWSDYKDNRVLHMYGKEHAGPCPLCDEALTDSNKGEGTAPDPMITTGNWEIDPDEIKVDKPYKVTEIHDSNKEEV